MSSAIVPSLVIFILFIICASDVECRKKAVSEDKTALMNKLSSHKGFVDIDNSNFKNLVKTNKKPYSVVLILTVSHPKRKCTHCLEAFEEFSIAASSWRFSADFDSTLFFAYVDFDFNGMEVFQALQVNTAPVVMYFDEGNNKPQLMLFEKYGFSAEGFAKFILRTANKNIVIKRPYNHSAILFVVAGIILASLLIYKDILTFSTLKSFPWGFAVLIFILLMTSGHMWNHIRDAQFMQYRENEMVFLESYGDGQFVIESYIILALNLAISLGLILLSEASGKGFPGTKKKAIAIGGILLVGFFFYLLMKVFKKKYEGYPYSFFFL